MNPKKLLLLPLVAGTLALGACDDTGTTDPAGDARVSILLTDAPGDVRAAVVTITDVYLQRAAGDTTEGPGRIYLRQDSPVTTDLLTLSNDVLELVDGEVIPAGRYSQMRFVISGAYLEVEGANGRSTVYATSPDYPGLPAGVQADGTLRCPSCAQSGFKVILGAAGGDDEAFRFEGDQTILVDFDVSKSFGKPAGNSGQWIMKPTLKATSIQTSSSVTVSLALADATVELPLVGGEQLTLGGFHATLAPAAGGDPKTVALTDADADGVYEATFRYLLPGEYRVGFTGPAGLSFTTDRALPLAVTAAAGSDVDVAFKLTGASLVE